MWYWHVASSLLLHSHFWCLYIIYHFVWLSHVIDSYNYLFLDEEPSSSRAMDAELSRSGSKQEYHIDPEPPSHPEPLSSRGSSQSLKGSRAELTTPDIDTRPFALIGPPPREPGARAKARCSTLPSRHRGTEAGYSLPRPSHSTSLTRFQQPATLTPLVPLGSSLAASLNPFSPATTVSPSSQQATQSPEPQVPIELFKLRGPPPQQPCSRGKARCSTLPARQRVPGPEEYSTKPSHSTSFTKLEDRTPPSPSELKRNKPTWGELVGRGNGQRVAEGGGGLSR